MTVYKFFTIGSILLLGKICFGQTDSSWRQKPEIHFSGFIDVFYAYDFNQPQTGIRQPFFYNHNRHNEFNLNLGILKGSIEHTNYRANLALQAGTYPNDNYAAEQGLLKNVFEANVGLSLNKKNNLWLDAGIFGSPIGFESPISIDNWTLTRSFLAENSPYYLSGAKLTFNPNEKWEVAALVCNGWQRIQKVPGNSMLSFGTQLKFTPSEKLLLNWSTFIGTDDPDSTRRMRYYNDFYGQFQLTKKLGLIAGFDIGTQQQTKKSSEYDFWFGPVMIARYSITDKWATAFRMEYYHDETGIIIPTGTTGGFRTSGISLNLDYTPAPNLFCRMEGRWLHSQEDIFQKGNNMIGNNFCLVTSIAIRFDK